MRLLLRSFININQSLPCFFTMSPRVLTTPTSARPPRASRKSSNVASPTTIANSSELTPPPIIPNKRQPSTIGATKRKARSLATPALKRAASSTVLEAEVDRQTSPDEGESQNSDLDDATQATQPRQPAVNSDILPLPWKGRLGFAYRTPNSNSLDSLF
jgi:hypothetical protein